MNENITYFDSCIPPRVMSGINVNGPSGREVISLQKTDSLVVLGM
jgi:hypothetical protein